MTHESPEGRAGFRWEAAAALVGLLVLTASLLYVTGRPLFTDDTWWHLGLGRAYASSGPWLDDAPSLHTNRTPPAPHGWLSDLALHLGAETVGLTGLRALHVATVVLILVGVWLLLARASRSRAVACSGTALFIVFSAYRLSQLRPELLTITAMLALYAILLEGRSIPTWGRVACAALLCGVWANLHPGFPLGPLTIAVAALGALVESSISPSPSAAGSGRRAARLAIASLVAAAATLANPMGADAYLPYFSSGSQGPSLSFVADEWAPLSPLRAPSIHLPPSPLAWTAHWMLVAASVVVATWRTRGFFAEKATSETPRPLDGSLMALCLLGLAASTFAVRFLWLSFFPLVFLAEASRELGSAGLRRLTAALMLFLVPAWFSAGDWPLLSSGVSMSIYRAPYDPWKYDGHAVHFLQESRLEGNLYNSYFMGGFLGYWLAPRLRTFIDGSLDVSPDVMEDYLAVQAGGLGHPGFDITETLDRHRVDVFVGIGFPTTPTPGRPWRHTTMHLHGRPGWVLAFRSMQSAVYLRRTERNRENFEKVKTFYARSGIDFDPRAGVDVARIVDGSPRWAIDHGLVPHDFEQLLEASRAPGGPIWVSSRLATTYLAIALDERALAVDEGLIRSIPTLEDPRRRRIAALLRLDRLEEALAEAKELEHLGPGSAISKLLIATARRHASLDENARRIELPFIPAISRSEAGQLRTFRELSIPLTSPVASSIP